ncbi:DUF4097 family beta strand repeat-containing protein [Caproicibacter fermentans]|uniref:DUF1700 domain-containing protein n=1 Tax=Caproicibacter fermentans TaxID=2576756 RepID=A0A7G8TBA0_9FIRM|nr:DUF4097 family beta strand repeat-containing protein [Caproicibacter fermentans]QNK40891.1 DUF1700 domain-containing protein [Caproicibacter fermentans]
MNKKQYFRRLKFLLRSLPRGEREKILQFYREILEDKIENGIPEENAVNELGDVHVLAQKILAENPVRRQMSPGKIVAIVLVSFFGVVLVAALTAAALGFAAYTQVKTSATASSSSTRDGGEKESRTYAAAADGVLTVQVNAENKKIELVSTDGDQITAQYCTAQDQVYKLSNQNGVFSVANKDLSYGSRFPDSWINGSVIDPADLITVKIPKDFAGDITVETSNSAIAASDFSKLGGFRCETSNSAICLSGISARDVKLESSNALISMENISTAGQLSARTDNAAISLERIASPDIKLETTNGMIRGTIQGRENDYTIDADTTNAVSNLQSRSGGEKKLSVHTSNGLIHIDFDE